MHSSLNKPSGFLSFRKHASSPKYATYKTKWLHQLLSLNKAPSLPEAAQPQFPGESFEYSDLNTNKARQQSTLMVPEKHLKSSDYDQRKQLH